MGHNGAERSGKMKYVALVSWFSTICISLVCAGGEAGRRPRELANLVWAWSGEFEDAVRLSKERGCTSVRVHVPWYLLEPKEGEFDFSWADGRVDFAVGQGMKVIVTVDCGRGRPAWLVGDELFARLADGSPAKYPDRPPYPNDPRRADDGLFPCVAHEKVRGYVARVMEKTVRHFQARHPGQVLFYYPVISHPEETELIPSVADPGKIIDYSQAAQRAFRRWAEARHGSLKNLSEAWGKKMGSWEEVRLQDAPGYDFFAFRAEMLGEFIDEYAAAIRKAGGVAAAQFGCIWDGLAFARGTLDCARLGRNLDWVIVDDGPAHFFDNRFSMSYLRGVRCGGRFANEIDGPWHPAASDEAFGRQGVITLEEGADAVVCANWSVAHLRDKENWTFWEKLGRMVRVRAPRVRARRAMFVSLAQVYTLFGKSDVYRAVGQEFNGLLAQTDGRVDIITETVLLEHPDWVAGYTDGIWVGEFNRRITDEAWKALKGLEVPVFIESEAVGSQDEYGRPRS